jgi:hypothetical protein
MAVVQIESVQRLRGGAMRVVGTVDGRGRYQADVNLAGSDRAAWKTQLATALVGLDTATPPNLDLLGTITV